MIWSVGAGNHLLEQNPTNMKKTFIIIGIIALVLALLGGAWWYLLMNGAPKGLSNIPNPFGTFDGDSEEFAPAPREPAIEPRVSGALRKLSEVPVAGAVLTRRDGASYARYVERGTGHIFEVDLASSATTRLTGTTIPRATRAVFSAQGTRVVLFTESADSNERVFAGAIERADSGEGTLATSELDPTARNIAFSATGESIYYTVPTATGSVGYEQNLKVDTGTRATLFTSPLRDIVVSWGSPASAELSLIAYTTPTAQQRGYAYEGAGFSRLFGGVPGLMVIPAQNYRVVSYAGDNTFISRTDTLAGTTLAVPAFPEKCATDASHPTTLWCAAPLALLPGDYPDAWYQGAISFDDSIWQVDVTTGSATLLSVPGDDVGETIDAVGMQATSDGDTLIFINKKDGSLWMQKTSS